MSFARAPRIIASGVLVLALGSCTRGASKPALPPEAALPLPAADKRLSLYRPGAAGKAAPSPLLLVLEEELKRNVAALSGEKTTAPYFVQYEAIDDHAVTIEASFGALVSSSDEHSRSLDADVRVGTRKLDNTHRLRGDYDVSRDFTRASFLPVEDDPGPIKNVAWLTTHAEYQRALEDYVRVRANKQVKVDEREESDDFSDAPATQFRQQPAGLVVDKKPWEDRLRTLSRAFAGHPEILESRVSLQANAETRYLTSSEGASVQIARTHARIEITAATVADDGMRLERTETADAPSLDALPKDDAIAALVERVSQDLIALRKAQPVEPYAGPAILDGRAAGVFFHEIFGHRVEGHRQKDEEEGQTFAHQVGQLVMPRFLNVFDDPSIFALNGVPLNGYYPFDDENVTGQLANLVEAGTLRGFLLSRSPLRDFPSSNGHGRRDHGRRVVSRQANLVVNPSVTTTKEALKQALIEQIRRENKPFGLRFHEITGGYTNTTRYGSQAFKVLPVMVYRIYPDGHEELVRGVDLEGTPLASLARIEAAANDFEVFNGVCGAESGWVPVSASSPSLLIGQIEVTRQEKGQDRPPLLPAPESGRSALR